MASLITAVGLIVRWEWRWAHRIELLVGYRWPWVGAMSTGVILLLFEIVELFMVPFHPVMHPLLIGWFLALVILALAPSTRTYLRPRGRLSDENLGSSSYQAFLSKQEPRAELTLWPLAVAALLGSCLPLVAVSSGGVLERMAVLLIGTLVTGAAAIRWTLESRAGGWATLALAVTGLVVGTGVGVRAVNVGATDFRTITALLALVGGVIELVAGIGRVTAGRHVVSRLLLGSLVLVLVAVTVWIVAR